MTAMRLPDGSIDCQLVPDFIGATPIDTPSSRLQQEFLSMPALCLTVEQAARLVDVSLVVAARLLTDFEHDGFLIRTAAGRYRLAEPPLD